MGDDAGGCDSQVLRQKLFGVSEGEALGNLREAQRESELSQEGFQRGKADCSGDGGAKSRRRAELPARHSSDRRGSSHRVCAIQHIPDDQRQLHSRASPAGVGKRPSSHSPGQGRYNSVPPLPPLKNMLTIICDIDGTLTDMWPIEKAILLKLLGENKTDEIEKIKSSGISDTYAIFSNLSKQKIDAEKYFTKYNQAFLKLKMDKNLPKIKKYPIVNWIIRNKNKYDFVYATGGQREETLFVLDKLNLLSTFDLENSIDKSVCPYSKQTGIPLQILKNKYPNCILITDSESDCVGAKIAKIPFLKI